MSLKDRGFRYFYYDPSEAAAIVFTAIFALSTVLHVFQMARTRVWFVIPFIVGGLFSFTGYLTRRILSTQTPDWKQGPFIVMSLALLLAPALFAATIYMELKRIIIAIKAEHASPVRVAWLTRIFVTGDVVCFLIQGGGGGLLAKGGESVDIGENLIVVGLFIQLAFFALFVLTSVLVHVRINKNPTALSNLPHLPWRKHVYCLYFMSILIFIRSTFRIIENLQGYRGYLLGHEVFIYIFDAALMSFVTYALNYVHPSEIDAWTHGGIVSRNLGTRYEWVGPADGKRVAGQESNEMVAMNGHGSNRTFV